MWTSAKSWKENWKPIEALDGGGQGTVKRVRRKCDDVIGFVKILNRQNDPDRRARFFREAVAYATSDHVGVPKLIESNSENYGDRDFKLYFVTEFIDGPTLTELITNRGPLPGNDAARITKKLLQAVAYCHAND